MLLHPLVDDCVIHKQEQATNSVMFVGEKDDCFKTLSKSKAWSPCFPIISRNRNETKQNVHHSQ